jgi:uncharacterized protein YuzE
MKIIWTKHAEERQKEWEKRLGVTRQEVEDLVNYPEQIVPGNIDALVAQARTRRGLLRVPLVEIEGERKGLTVYWTSKIERYWKEKKENEDKYDSEADVLLFILRDDPPVDAIEESGGIVVSYGEDGEPVSVEFLNASVRRLIQAGEVSITPQSKKVSIT